MTPSYRDEKAAQAAGWLLARCGGQMNYMKLIKLLYLAEREALIRWGRPITYDAAMCLPDGPVLSLTLRNIRRVLVPGDISYWHRYISECEDNTVRLLRDDCPNDALSEAEDQLLSEVFERFGHMDQRQLREHTLELPECEGANVSSRRIEYRAILTGAGVSVEDAKEIELELEELNSMERLR